MNWKQAMGAMSEGYKVRGIKWEAGSWISASVRYVDCYFDLDDLMNLTYEIFDEQPIKGDPK